MGWLLAHCVTGPVLVFDDKDAGRAQVLREDMHLAQFRVLAAHRGIGRADKLERRRYALAIRQLRKAQQVLVKLAIGYTFPGARDPATGWRAMFAFEVEP